MSFSDLRNSDLYHTNFAFSKLIKANLSYAIFTECNLINADFSRANLMYAIFDDCIIENQVDINDHKKYQFVDLILKVESKEAWFKARLPDFNGVEYVDSVVFSKDTGINKAVKEKIKKYLK